MTSKSSARNATFKCHLCPQKYTRALNLEGHIRTHTGERPFVCGVCGKDFTRHNERRSHEQCHNSKIKFVCGGLLENGKSWGCGRSYVHKKNLRRHHRDKIGRGCIEPTSDADAAEESASVEERLEVQVPGPARPTPQPTNAEHSTAIALMDIVRTSNISEISGLPSLQPNNFQDTALASINDASRRADWGHTAAVTKLVMWPSVKILLDPFEYDHDNLMRVERQREPIYARDLRDIPSQVDDTILLTSSFAHDDAGGGNKPNLDERSKVHAEVLSIHSYVEIDQFGVFKLSEKTSRRYYQSYLDRMHKLHPFLDEQELDVKVEAFIKCYSPRKLMSTTEDNRCHAGIEVIGGLLDDSSSPGQFVEPNIDNAITLLIFAVGAICDSKIPTPSPIMNQRADSHLPRFSGPVRQAKLTEYFSPAPGLALYRLATATLGYLQGASDLKYVHARLLAGIYAGQFADAFQSHVWISEAARACQALVQRPRNEDMNDHTKELRNFAYWSCLQLESDLIAELDIPASGMSRFEDLVSLPRRGYPINGPHGLISPSTIMMMYYYSQIHIQKIRNQVHTNPYEIKIEGQASRLSTVQTAQVINLDLWRRSLPLPLQWEDTQEPAKDINAACLRAIYYRTSYILHLPLLYYTIHYGQPSVRDECRAQLSVDSPTGSTSTSETQSYSNLPRMKHILSAIDSDTSNISLKFSQNWAPPTDHRKELPPVVRASCKTCVDCAIQSLMAFDGIEGRLVIPNIFGTAHEQFGYLLVLSATYKSSLSELVDRSTLDRLFKRTIRFLRLSENNSPTLRADNRILKEIYSKLFTCASIPTDA